MILGLDVKLSFELFPLREKNSVLLIGNVKVSAAGFNESEWVYVKLVNCSFKLVKIFCIASCANIFSICPWTSCKGFNWPFFISTSLIILTPYLVLIGAEIWPTDI